MNFSRAAQSLIQSKKIAILTGFACILDSEPHYETDGIAGSFALARCLLNMNKKVTILLDQHSESYMKEIVVEYFKDINTSLQINLNTLYFETGHDSLTDQSLKSLKEISETYDAIVSIERPSVTVTY